MIHEEYENAVKKSLRELIADVLPSVNSEDAVVDKLSLIRMLVKGSTDSNVRTVSCALYGLLLADLPVTDQNLRWLLRDNSVGFDAENELFNNSGNHRVRLYPVMDEYKSELKSLHEELR